MKANIILLKKLHGNLSLLKQDLYHWSDSGNFDAGMSLLWSTIYSLEQQDTDEAIVRVLVRIAKNWRS